MQEFIEAHQTPTEVCRICLEDVASDFVRTPCCHYYHPPCLAAYCKSFRDTPFEVNSGAIVIISVDLLTSSCRNRTPCSIRACAHITRARLSGAPT